MMACGEGAGHCGGMAPTRALRGWAGARRGRENGESGGHGVACGGKQGGWDVGAAAVLGGKSGGGWTTAWEGRSRCRRRRG
jgi:hypothetical protein